MFIAAIFVIAKIWKQPKYPSMGEWIKNVVYTYVQPQEGSHKAFAATWKTLLSETNQAQKDK